MSWGLGWKRASDVFRLTLNYGTDESAGDQKPGSPPCQCSSSPRASLPRGEECSFRIDLDWNAGDDEEQVALKLQSQLMVALPMPQDSVTVGLRRVEDEEEIVEVDMKVVKRREPLRGITMMKAVPGQQGDGVGVLARVLRSSFVSSSGGDVIGLGFEEHWRTVTLISLCNCSLSVIPPELLRLPFLEKIYLNNNRLSVLPPELGELKSLKILSVDHNALASVPAVELRQCVGLVELSLEHNKLIRPLLDFRAMSELQILRLFGNPMEFLPEILPLQKLHHLSLANVRIVGDENLRSVDVQMEMENSSYFGASRHKLSAFFSLIFRFSSCHHPLLAAALAKIMQDHGNCLVVGKDENALRQLISMITSENHHVVEQACSALSSLAGDVSVAMQLMKCDIMQPIEAVLKSNSEEEVISVLQVMATLAFASDTVASKMLTKDILKSMKLLCANRNPEVQRLSLLVVGNLAFCLENRRVLVASESLRDLLLHLAVSSYARVNNAAIRALAILGENENLRRTLKGRQVSKQGLRILSMDGGGMKGLATVQILKAIEKGTGKCIHELFDLICGTSTGGMLAVALGIKQMTLAQCEEIYKNLGKLVFAEPVPKDNEAATWREKLDQLYKSSSQSFRVVVHGSKHSADQFERLLKEICSDEDGDLLIESAVKNSPKVFVVSTLVSVMPAQPYIFRNYQYPAGTPEVSFAVSESVGVTTFGQPTTGAQVGYTRSAFIGSCKHHIWQAIRASSAAPYYLDDFSDDVNRWQDGAIVANNPAVFAIREAQLLWPDTRIDCLVSIGCGSIPTKVRKGGWRYLDTGQVLIESACSVDRVEEALSTLLTLLPDIHYFRFNPVDERCDMELDETDPAVWLKLETAVKEYLRANSEALDNVCQRLLLVDEIGPNQSPNAIAAAVDGNGPCLGWRREVLLVEASASHGSGTISHHHHTQALESFCVENKIKLSTLRDTFGIGNPMANTSASSFITSPMFGSDPSSPTRSSLDLGLHKTSRNDSIPPFGLDGVQSRKGSSSPPSSPLRQRQFSFPVRSLHDKLQSTSRVGIVHLALQNDLFGSILSWKNDVFVLAEPGDRAEKFLQHVKLSLLSMIRSHRKRITSILANISSVADLVQCKPCFQVGNVMHRYIGRQTQVLDDGQEFCAYMFRRTVPSLHLTPDDVRWMVGAWRERIIIYTGTYGPRSALIKSFLDSGAKAVICPTEEPREIPSLLAHGSGDLHFFENGKFVIGDEEDELGDDDAGQPSSSGSDWGDSDGGRDEEVSASFWDDDELDLSNFVAHLYDALFKGGGLGVDVALRRALSSHRLLKFTCHLPCIH